jgi:hypothetical protein
MAKDLHRYIAKDDRPIAMYMNPKIIRYKKED